MTLKPLEDRGGVLKELKSTYPSLRFVFGKRFAFRPPRTILVSASFSGNNADSLLLLHEVGHALIKRFDFKTEVERLKIEVEAWEKARELAPLYGVVVNEELIENELDTYRDFLHQKSRCPNCGLTRFQTPDGVWHCPKCDI